MAAVFIRVIVIFLALPRLFRCNIERSGFKINGTASGRGTVGITAGGLKGICAVSWVSGHLETCNRIRFRPTSLQPSHALFSLLHSAQWKLPTCDNDSAFSCCISIFVSGFQVVMVQQQICPRFPAWLLQNRAGTVTAWKTPAPLFVSKLSVRVELFRACSLQLSALFFPAWQIFDTVPGRLKRRFGIWEQGFFFVLFPQRGFSNSP